MSVACSSSFFRLKQRGLPAMLLRARREPLRTFLRERSGPCTFAGVARRQMNHSRDEQKRDKNLLFQEKGTHMKIPPDRLPSDPGDSARAHDGGCGRREDGGRYSNGRDKYRSVIRKSSPKKSFQETGRYFVRVILQLMPCGSHWSQIFAISIDEICLPLEAWQSRARGQA